MSEKLNDVKLNDITFIVQFEYTATPVGDKALSLPETIESLYNQHGPDVTMNILANWMASICISLQQDVEITNKIYKLKIEITDESE